MNRTFKKPRARNGKEKTSNKKKCSESRSLNCCVFRVKGLRNCEEHITYIADCLRGICATEALLEDLFPEDSGDLCPNPVGAAKLAQLKLVACCCLSWRLVL